MKLHATGKRKQPDMDRLFKVNNPRRIKSMYDYEDYLKQVNKRIKKLNKFKYGSQEYKKCYNKSVVELWEIYKKYELK